MCVMLNSGIGRYRQLYVLSLSCFPNVLDQCDIYSEEMKWWYVTKHSISPLPPGKIWKEKTKEKEKKKRLVMGQQSRDCHRGYGQVLSCHRWQVWQTVKQGAFWFATRNPLVTSNLYRSISRTSISLQCRRSIAVIPSVWQRVAYESIAICVRP